MKTKPIAPLRPGQVAPKSGQIKETGSNLEKTIVQGDRLPPTSQPGKTYKYVDFTKHKK